ncbi:SDR family oxidoreductase [Sorangium sp. So ce394]
MARTQACREDSKSLRAAPGATWCPPCPRPEGGRRHARRTPGASPAGIINKLVIDMSLDDWNSIMNVNVTGVFLHSREALRAMIPNRRGAIVNIGSYACFFGFPQIAAYAASKGALAQLTRVLALEAIDHGVRVNAVGSGDVVTNLLNDIRPDGREFLRDHGKGAPIRRAAAPEEIAEVVAFLASDKASFMVGSIVMADGGYSVAIQPGE